MVDIAKEDIMALRPEERLVLEAVQNFLQQDAELGLANHDEEEFKDERGYEYLHNHVDELFHLKAAGSPYFNDITAAFNKVHSYKYVDDPTFETAFKKELVAMGVPADDTKKSMDYIKSVVDELKASQADWAEKDSFHPDMDEIVKVTQPEQNDSEFEIEDSDLNEQNIDDQEPGDV